MLKFLVLLTYAVTVVSGQTWASKANLKGGIEYWHNVMQEMVYELEQIGWCNLKLKDVSQTINDYLYNMHVNGTVKYTNGFVVSIQKIDLTDIKTNVVSRTVDGTAVPFGTAQGTLNFRDMVIGFDVDADLSSPEGQYKTTGTLPLTLVDIDLYLDRNLVTKVSTVTSTVSGTSVKSGAKMNYMPSSNVTEALGRRFLHSTFDSAENWAKNIFTPIILNIVDNKLDFPSVCFNNC